MYRLIRLTDAEDGTMVGLRVDIITSLERILPGQEIGASDATDPEQEVEPELAQSEYTLVTTDQRDADGELFEFQVSEPVERIARMIDEALEWTAERFYDFEQPEPWQREED